MNARSRGGLLALLITAMAAGCAHSATDSVADAKQVNAAQPSAVSKPAATFLVEMVDARLMDFEEGRQAAQRGSTPAIRDYGRLMMREQTRLLGQLEVLALALQVTVPATISADKRDGLNNLIDADRDSFDKRFIKSMRIDHQRDVGKFKEASEFPDVTVADFARRHLPLIQAHLDGIEAIKKDY